MYKNRYNYIVDQEDKDTIDAIIKVSPDEGVIDSIIGRAVYLYYPERVPSNPDIKKALKHYLFGIKLIKGLI